MRDNKLYSLSTVIHALNAEAIGGDIHITDEQFNLPDNVTETVISTWAGRRFVLELKPLKDFGPAFDLETGAEMTREEFLKKYPGYEESGDYPEND